MTVAEANGRPDEMKFWPQITEEIIRWKFVPFEMDGKAVMAQIEETVQLVPPERLPTSHVAAPIFGPSSKVMITLARSGGCEGTCPGYKVSVGTDGIVFEGSYKVAAAGKHTEKIDLDEVRALVREFIVADFFSMDPQYITEVTDIGSSTLSIEIDGHAKQVANDWGELVGMPGIIRELEDEVDTITRSERWVNCKDGLVPALQGELFNFRSPEAQIMLKECAS